MAERNNSNMLFANFNQDFSITHLTLIPIPVPASDVANVVCLCGLVDDGARGIVEMLFCTSLIALVGAGDQPQNSSRKLQIVNTKRQSMICELLFPSSILAVKMNRKTLVIVLETEIYIYDISNMRLLHVIETTPNPEAICALSPSADSSYLAYPSPVPSSSSAPLSAPGSSGTTSTSSSTPAAPASSSSGSGDVLLFSTRSLTVSNVIQAHKSPISHLAINSTGTLLATTSEKGTVVRVWSIPGAEKLYQFRRGTREAKIYSMNFNVVSSLLAVSSANGTVHIFKLGKQGSSSNADSKSLTSTSGGRKSPPDSLDGRESINTNNSEVVGGYEAFAADKKERASGGASSFLKKKGLGVAKSLTSSDESVVALFAWLDSCMDPVAGWVIGLDLTGRVRLDRASYRLSSVGGYLPNSITEIWEPVRDFASLRLPSAGSGGGSVRSVVALSGTMPHVMVISSEGYFYLYSIDLENGGECALLKQYSLLDSVDVDPASDGGP
ncbi:autophagy-type protein 18 [Coprinopsis cinerea okayama7|uniref:Autophagy-type protein 18 n=1 Tax=Coprinopsis cinerea (strain Okayama-7 / 130 / ATCC MYA-4618 / FGSC 9003) TaxID=240176 RepID=A8P4V5_COPC7|nr:autophagy-type protein 18 [Coprinopsis cinerea okayama7\|eukprot:XP_001838822.2 autophagy-type protein 18 [Coprinopsis cinerea okayama7\